MTEQDKALFREIYAVYDKYRGRTMSVDDDFAECMTEICSIGVKYDWGNNPLANHLVMAIIDTFNDLYKDGKTPVEPSFFGRGDL